MRASFVLVLFLALGCNRAPEQERTGSAACGLAALAGPTALLGQFSVPDQTLDAPPRQLPERVVVRLVGGPAYPAIVGRVDSLWVVGMEGSLLYEGTPVEGAPEIGTVSVGNSTVPLIGIRLDPAKIEDPRCPFFPDTVLR